jgi:hypothetical protein
LGIVCGRMFEQVLKKLIRCVPNNILNKHCEHISITQDGNMMNMHCSKILIINCGMATCLTSFTVAT